MAITTYAELQTAIAGWLHRSDLTSAIPDFITLAEVEIFRKLRVREMEASFSDAIVAPGVLPLPASYIALKYAYVSVQPIQWLERKPARWIHAQYANAATTGIPHFVAREGSNFIFGPQPGGLYTVTGVYYKNIGPLSASAHALFLANPDCYLFGSLLQAVPYLKNDARVELWNARYAAMMQSAQLQSDTEDDSGSPLMMVPA